MRGEIGMSGSGAGNGIGQSGAVSSEERKSGAGRAETMLIEQGQSAAGDGNGQQDSVYVWARELWRRMEEKLYRSLLKNGNKILYTVDQNGDGEDRYEQRSSIWVNGFWPGILWQLYQGTESGERKALYADHAKTMEKMLDKALFETDEGFEGLHHDVGFMWMPTSAASYRLTKDSASRRRALIAANYLAARWNPDARFLTAWNGKEKEGWSIIDTMMNLSLLYWASEETGYERFARIAELHAEKTMKNAVRPDGSVIHIIHYDLRTGEALESFGGQGYGVGSSWTRGQAWAVYGFADAYLHTGRQEFLDTAKRVAHYFLASAAQSGYVPYVDFRSPGEPLLYDSTAGAIAASGLLTLAQLVPELEKRLYKNGAILLLKALEAECCDFSEETDLVLAKGAEAYRYQKQKYIVYGDFYFLEALGKLWEIAGTDGKR